MYSADITKLLKKNNVTLGDRVKVTSLQGEFEGIVMPHPSYGDPSILILKLDSGYNAGLRVSSLQLVEKSVQHKSKVAAPHPVRESANASSEASISILGCGGTIASKIEYMTGAVYPSISSDELRASFPALARWPIRSRQIFSLFSEDMGITHWKKLAEEIEAEIKDGSNGVVVMHGTDTLSYTSAAMAFMLQKLPVPVVFVGSQRSSDRPSSDNDMNMMNAVFSATQNVGESLVCMHATSNDEYCHVHRGVRVRKMHTSARDAFQSINSSPLFLSDYRADRFESLTGSDQDMPPIKRAAKSELIHSKKMSDNVAMVYVHPGIKPNIISKLNSYDGVVLLGTGLGHVPVNSFADKTVHGIYKPICELISSGIPVVMSPQTIYGRLCMRVYATGRLLIEAGVIGDGADWTPESAYVKLCWVLGQEKGKGKGGMKQVADMMMTNYVGELSSRSLDVF